MNPLPPPNIKPYHDDGNGIVIYHGDCSKIAPRLNFKFDLMLTDPPYGIKKDSGANDGGTDSTGKYIRHPKKYLEKWDDDSPSAETFKSLFDLSYIQIIWGANYFSNKIPQGNKWLVWDKAQFMPTYSDAELAYTNFKGDAVKMFRYSQNAQRGAEFREHPTQKPLQLFLWCIGLVKDCETVFDPFAGSGTTGRAAKDLGKKCVMIEREESFCEVAARRLQQEVLI